MVQLLYTYQPAPSGITETKLFRIKIGKILRSFLAKCQITLLKNDTILLVGMIPKLVIRQQILRFFVG